MTQFIKARVTRAQFMRFVIRDYTGADGRVPKFNKRGYLRTFGGLTLKVVRCRRGDHPGFKHCDGWRTEFVGWSA
jgi:hypothetical protein